MGCTGSSTVVETLDSRRPAPLNAKAIAEREFHKEYALKEKLGQGANAVVYAATRTESSTEQFAVKVCDLRNSLSQHVDFDDKIMRLDRRRQRNITNEVAMLSAVSGHANICRTFGHFIHGGLAYIVLERYQTLPSALDGCATLNEEVLRPFFQGMLKGIAAVHSRHIVHRDIKPDNFMCSGPDNTVKLCDFGLACTVASLSAPDNRHCGGVVGTAPYMSPEMLEHKEYSTKVDVWSLGVVVHVLISGCFPYTPHEQTGSSMKAAILRGLPASKILDASAHHSTPGDISEETRRLILKLLSRSANQRPICRTALQDEFFTSRSLRQTCLRQAFEAAKSCGAFVHSNMGKEDIGDVDLRLRQLQDRLCEFGKAEPRAPSSEVSTDAGSRLCESS